MRVRSDGIGWDSNPGLSFCTSYFQNILGLQGRSLRGGGGSVMDPAMCTPRAKAAAPLGLELLGTLYSTFSEPPGSLAAQLVIHVLNPNHGHVTSVIPFLYT